MDGCELFNVGRATHWAFTDGLGVNPKADLETVGLAILILRQVARPSICQGTPRGIIDRELGGHCTHDEFCTRCPQGTWQSLVSDEPRTRYLRSQVQRFADQANAAPLLRRKTLRSAWEKEKEDNFIFINVLIFQEIKIFHQ